MIVSLFADDAFGEHQISLQQRLTLPDAEADHMYWHAVTRSEVCRAEAVAAH
jgi:hypothetical protein